MRLRVGSIIAKDLLEISILDVQEDEKQIAVQTIAK